MSPAVPPAASPMDSSSPAPARLLCLDTTTERMAVALTDGLQTHTLEEAGGALASARLLPAVAELVQRSAWPLASLQAVAFARGPGAFTGLRTAAAAAQGLALGLDIPVLPLDSLMIVAEDHRMHAGHAQTAIEVWVAMDARMGEIYAATYRHDATDRWSPCAWRVQRSPTLVSATAWLQAWRETGPAAPNAGKPQRCVVGTALSAHALLASLDADVPTQVDTQDRASALARVAWQAHSDGLHVDAALAWPSYVRDKVALTTQERAVPRAGLAP